MLNQNNCGLLFFSSRTKEISNFLHVPRTYKNQLLSCCMYVCLGKFFPTIKRSSSLPSLYILYAQPFLKPLRDPRRHSREMSHVKKPVDVDEVWLKKSLDIHDRLHRQESRNPSFAGSM